MREKVIVYVCEGQRNIERELANERLCTREKETHREGEREEKRYRELLCEREKERQSVSVRVCACACVRVCARLSLVYVGVFV